MVSLTLPVVADGGATARQQQMHQGARLAAIRRVQGNKEQRVPLAAVVLQREPGLLSPKP